MNSRERVQAVLNHKQADRVALDFSGHRSSGIMIQAYKKLREFLGLPMGNLYIYDLIQQLAAVEDDIIDIIDRLTSFPWDTTIQRRMATGRIGNSKTGQHAKYRRLST